MVVKKGAVQGKRARIMKCQDMMSRIRSYRSIHMSINRYPGQEFWDAQVSITYDAELTLLMKHVLQVFRK